MAKVAEADVEGVALGVQPFVVHVEQAVISIYELEVVQLVLLVGTTFLHSDYFDDVICYFRLHHYEIS